MLLNERDMAADEEIKVKNKNYTQKRKIKIKIWVVASAFSVYLSYKVV